MSDTHEGAPPRRRGRLQTLLGLSGILSAAFIVTATVVGVALREDADHVSFTISELYETGAPNAGWLMVLFTAYHALVIPLAIGLHRGLPAARRGWIGPVLLGLAGALGIPLGAYARCDPGCFGATTFRGQLHGVLVLVTVPLIFGAMFAIWHRLRRHESWRRFRRYTLATAVIGLGFGIGMAPFVQGPFAGLLERINVAILLQWYVVSGVVLIRSARGGARPRRPHRLRRALLTIALLPALFYLLCVLGFFYLRFLPPVATGVQAQRSVERFLADASPVRDYRWRPVEEISPHFPRAVVAAEDARFFSHTGFDWEELDQAREQAERRGRPMRGASTLTHQLIKNLYFTTHRNPVRKVYEWALAVPAEYILGKDRILELYVNVVELGPGVFGAEAAARYHYGISADRLTRHQAASLAAILPAPLRRRPQAMVRYTAIIEDRMSQLGW